MAENNIDPSALLSQEEMDKILAETRQDREERNKEIPGVSLSMDELAALLSGGSPVPPPKPVERAKQVTVILGRTKWTSEQKNSFMCGEPLELDTFVGAPVDVMEDGRLVAKGEIIRRNGHNAVKLSSEED